MALPHTGDRYQDVRVFSVQRRNGDRHKRSWIVRWSVDRRQYSRSFETKALADRFRTDLYVAQRSGEAFGSEKGLPERWTSVRANHSVASWARRWLEEQWAEWAPRTRTSAVEALSRLLPLLTKDEAPLPAPGFRRALVEWLDPTTEVQNECEVARYFSKWALALEELDRELLAEVDRRLGLADDGRLLSPSTASRRRKVSRACIRRAVELGVITDDPWPPAPRGRSSRKSVRTARRVTVRNLPDPSSMAQVIDAMRNHQPGSRRIQLMTAVAYYGGLRPSEVVMLRASALELPPAGWGSINVVEADVSFDEPGEPKTGPREVPIPPVLVDMLRTWLVSMCLSGDELLFRTRSGRRPSASNWCRALHRAVRIVGVPSMRVYDCRHAAATTWLRAGVPLGEVARRMGHSVETLVRTYVGALGDDSDVANGRIDVVLATAGALANSATVDARA